MKGDPKRPAEEPEELDAETVRILTERDATFEQDRLTAVDAKEAIAEMRVRLKSPQPQ